MNRLIIYLIVCITATNVRIHVANNVHQHHHLTNAAVGQDSGKTYLDDQTLTIPLQIGQQSIQATIDTTSHISWVLSENPDTSKCDKCPKDAKLFKCGGSCQITKDETTKQNAPLTQETTYGGRTQASGLYATEESLSLIGLDSKKTGLGLINKFITQDDKLTKEGVLGLAYGSDYQDYQKKKNAQVGVVESNLALAPENSLIQQLHSQLNNVPQSTFALKLEDNLKVLIVGEQQNYFADSKFTKFTNVGKRVWALDIKSASIGKEQTFLSTGTAVFDSTTKFIWSDKTTINKFIEKLNLSCTVGADGIPKCPCADDEQYNKFQDIYFSFNLNDQTFPISKADFIHREDKDCFLFIKELPSTNTLLLNLAQPVVILPHSFFKQNYVQFDLDNNVINIAQAYNVNPDPLYLDSNTLLWVSIVGAFLLLASLFLLINCLHKAPYDPDYMHFSNAAQQPAQNIQQQPPVYQQPPPIQNFGTQYGVPQSYQIPQQRPQPPLYQGQGMFNTSPYRQNQVNPVAALPGQFRQ